MIHIFRKKQKALNKVVQLTSAGVQWEVMKIPATLMSLLTVKKGNMLVDNRPNFVYVVWSGESLLDENGEIKA